MLSLPTLLLALLCDLQGSCGCTVPSLNLSELPLSTLSDMHSRGHSIHDFLQSQGQSGAAEGREREFRTKLEPQTLSILGRKNPRALDHLKEDCSPLLNTTAWLHLSPQVCQEGTIRVHCLFSA